MDQKVRMIQTKKCLEMLSESNSQGIYSCINSSKDILADFFILNAILPFDNFKNQSNDFPFDSERNLKLMRMCIKAVLVASRAVFSLSTGMMEPLKFKKIVLSELSMSCEQEKNNSPEKVNQNELKRVESIQIQDKEIAENQSRHSIMRLEKAAFFFSRLDISKDNYTIKNLKQPDLKKVILIIPKFELDSNSLSFQKKKELKRDNSTTIEWFDYDNYFEWRPLTKDFSFYNFDCLVHEFGVQGYIIRELFRFFEKTTDVLRIRTESTVRRTCFSTLPSGQLGSDMINCNIYF